MQINLFSVLMAVLWSSFLTAFIYISRKNPLMIKLFGVSSLMVLYLFCLMRIVFPLEFSFTQVIPSRWLYNRMIMVLDWEIIETDGFKISICTLLFCIWAAGTMGFFIRLLHQYYYSIKKIAGFDKREDIQIQAIFEYVQQNSKKKISANVLCSSHIDVPMGIGIVNRFILLPDKNYDNQVLYYILLHEYTHLINRDLMVKWLICIFQCIFWWNPVIYLLKKDLSQILEIKCDLTIIENMTNDEKADYLTAIVNVMKKFENQRRKDMAVCSVDLFQKNDCAQVKERFKIVSEYKMTKNRKAKTVILIVYFVTILFSYTFVIQSEYEAPLDEIETEKEVYKIEKSENFILKNKDDSYEIILPSGKRKVIEEQKAMDMEKQGFKIIESE